MSDIPYGETVNSNEPVPTVQYDPRQNDVENQIIYIRVNNERKYSLNRCVCVVFCVILSSFVLSMIIWGLVSV